MNKNVAPVPFLNHLLEFGGTWKLNCCPYVSYKRSCPRPSLVPWVRVMAPLHWAARCYCRITVRLIETNDSNNGTLSSQAGFVVGLISVAVEESHADSSKEAD